MIKHCVFLNLAEDADVDRLMDAYEMIGEVLDDIEGVFDFVENEKPITGDKERVSKLKALHKK